MKTPKLKSVYRCQQCGFSSAKWFGQCPDCGQWNTLVEEAVELPGKGSGKSRALTEFSSEITRLSGEGVPEKNLSSCRSTGISEFDRVLGGGLVSGQVLLLAGPPGIGKSTLMLQLAAGIAPHPDGSYGGVTPGVLYVSGEESLNQIRSRACRLKLKSDNIYLLSETNLGKIIDAFHKTKPAVIILDSIQTVFHPEYAGSPGSVGQVRECAAELLRVCKSGDSILFILGHVTKEGTLAGPKILEHIVDTVLDLDIERNQILRILRAHKNRFGPTSEVGIFEMGEQGLSGISDASMLFTSFSSFADSRRERAIAGRAFSVAMEGARPMLAELQALASPTRYPLPRRMTTGLDLNRAQLLLAAMEKHIKLRLENSDVFASLAGGIKFSDPALDLALCASIISSARDVPVQADVIFIGEVGILGQVARVPWMARRLAEADRLGFKKAFAPSLPSKDMPKLKSLEIIATDDLASLISYMKGS